MASTPAGGQRPLRPCCDVHGKERKVYVGASIQLIFLQAASFFFQGKAIRGQAQLLRPLVSER